MLHIDDDSSLAEVLQLFTGANNKLQSRHRDERAVALGSFRKQLKPKKIIREDQTEPGPKYVQVQDSTK